MPELHTTYMYIVYKMQKHFQNVVLAGMASEISKKYAYKCQVWIAQDTTESRGP